jgi:hypothetical protein
MISANSIEMNQMVKIILRARPCGTDIEKLDWVQSVSAA